MFALKLLFIVSVTTTTSYCADPAGDGRFTLIGPGYVSYAQPAVMEKVLANRIRFGQVSKEADYTVLAGLPECAHLGRTGYLLTETYSPTKLLVVDCEAKQHKGMMNDRRLLVDVDDLRYVHQFGAVVLLPERLVCSEK